ncbi:uncharacterized protein LOC115631865 [Scaptodrosophila lebanonensis]|uniref:Uncharacterized protein LOC115631865 n=1 Tax=Drosophila lebanonensis TaxID=7225 RepID=A0A6J2U7T4_DROLE|nr:uncharacterized protein LOC115631865 [Scaptodrosophila lebanonensis]
MADESITRMNLSAIKKIDPYAKEIVDSSSHVAFYTFNSQQNEWEKTDVEGAFFIYHRNAEPFHSIFINNRLNTTSFVEPITGSLELQSQPPFLLYRNERSRIRGFWFYNSEECDRISNLVNSLLQNKESNGPHAPAASANNLLSQSKPENASIFNMLSKAQQEYNAKLNIPQQNSAQLENATPCNVLKFFESAKQATADAFFNRVQQPLSVDQLEKQQRVATPSEGHSQASAREVDLAGSSECRLSPFQQASASAINVNSANALLLGKPKIGQSFVDSNSSLFAADEAEQCLRRLLVGEQSSGDARPALMPPTMFDAPNAKLETGTHSRQQSESHTLNSAQFVQAFTYLIQNDKEFVNKLHKAYLKSCSNALLDTSRTYQ